MNSLKMGFKQQLIAEVRRRPAIWNTKCEEYKNRHLTDQHWDTIAKKLNRSKSDVKTKWRNLRDVYRRELRRTRLRAAAGAGAAGAGAAGAGAAGAGYGGKWMFFRHMSFLGDSAALAGADGGGGEVLLPKEEPSSDESSYSLEPEPEPPEPPAEYPRLAAVDVQPYEPGDSADLLFFKSLVPFMECLSPVQRLRLRSRIQDLVAEELGGGGGGGGGAPCRGPSSK